MRQPMHILFVEDVETEAELAVRELARGGITCDYKRVDTEKALRDVLKTFKPDIVLSDFSLPQFDGMSALRIVRELLPDVPFIFVSGTIGEELAIQALHNGATDYVLKTNLRKLVPSIKRAIAEVRERQEKLRMEAALRQSENTLRDIVETIQEWIFETDSERRILFSNSYVSEILGCSREEIIGTSVDGFLDAEERGALIAEWSAKHDPAQVVNSVARRWRHRDGSSRWLEEKVIVRCDARGAPLGFRGALRDVTQRRLHEGHIARISRMHAMLSNVNSAIVRIRSRTELFKELCRVSVDIGGYAIAYVSVIEDATLKPLVWMGQGADFLRDLRIPLAATDRASSSLTARALHSREIVVSNDIAREARPVYQRNDLLKRGYRSAAILPLESNGKVIGALSLYTAETGVFTESEIALLRELAGDISFAIQSIENERALHYLAFYDALTNMANRSLFSERLSQMISAAKENNRPIYLVLMDLERLHTINNSFGRHAGDQVIRAIGQRLLTAVGDGTHAGYCGANCFAIAVTAVDGENQLADWVRERITGAISEPISIDGNSLYITAKYGVASCPQDARDADMLLRNAEAALRWAKTHNEAYARYAVRMNTEVSERLTLENKLRQALELRQYVLHYQPKVRMDTGEISGVEALLRWQDPETGLVPPMKFIPLLEETGLIVDVGQWIIKQAIADHAQWTDLGLVPPRIAVNISAVQLHDADFVAQTLKLVSGIRPEDMYIEFEITESMLMSDVDQSIGKLRSLRDAGIKIAIDDFGTGYSSLSYLTKLPVDTLKIDRSFVNGITTDADKKAIVATIISMARSLGKVTVAEGVETREQHAFLRQMNCDEIQGYLISQPVSAELLVAQLRARILVH